MLQTAFNGLVSGVIMTLPALAVTLLFGVLKFPNFAVGAMMTVAAYMVFALNGQLGWPLAAATALVAFAFELARPFRFLDMRMNREQMITIAISALAMALMWLLLTRTPVGRAMRAV